MLLLSKFVLETRFSKSLQPFRCWAHADLSDFFFRSTGESAASSHQVRGISGASGRASGKSHSSGLWLQIVPLGGTTWHARSDWQPASWQQHGVCFFSILWPSPWPHRPLLHSCPWQGYWVDMSKTTLITMGDISLCCGEEQRRSQMSEAHAERPGLDRCLDVVITPALGTK